MIINNYNGSLTENPETDLTSTKCPMINIRAFDPNLKAGDHLVIPYYVADFDQTEYRKEKLGPTFTTIFALDEDTVPANQVQTWKQTTYAGEQVIDLGVFSAVGIHTLNVRTIQSNGVGSATKPLKFIVRLTGTKTLLDLSTLSGFSGEFTNYRRYNMVNLQSWDGIGPCLSMYNCNYSVTKTVEVLKGKSVVTDIQIVITKPTGFTGHCVTNYKIEDDGEIDGTGSSAIDHYLDIDQWETGGEYHVATKCVVDGETVMLKDYLGVPLSELPAAVIEAAAKNKVALTRLFEAAKAWRFQQVYESLISGGSAAQDAAIEASDAVKYEFEFKMPAMDIVCDYHYVNGLSCWDNRGTWTASQLNERISIEGTSSEGSGGLQANLAYKNRKYFHGRDDIMVPDGIFIDMNGTTISMLQITNVKGGSLLKILNNVNSHVVNGNFVGNYKGVEFAHTDDMETLHMLDCHSSLFCSFENLDVSWSAGYELHIGNDEGQQIGENDSLLIRFTTRGCIDNEGNAQELSGTGKGWYYTGGISKILNYGWTVSGREIRITKFHAGMGDFWYTPSCREMYVHFYDMQGNFIKTVKVLQRWPVLIPYGAWKMKLSMYGTNDNGNDDSLNYNNNEGEWARNFCNLSWGCGVKGIKFHDTRTCTLDNGGVQTYVKDVVFQNVAAERYGQGTHYEDDFYHFTKMLVDYEDDSFNLYNGSLDNLEMTFGDSRAVNIVRGNDLHIRNCRNIHIEYGLEVADALIENSAISMTAHHGSYDRGSGLHIITRNCIIKALDNPDYGKDYENSGRIYVRSNSLLTRPKGDSNHNEDGVDYKVNVYPSIKI